MSDDAGTLATRSLEDDSLSLFLAEVRRHRLLGRAEDQLAASRELDALGRAA
jgi:hypothetical protein